MRSNTLDVAAAARHLPDGAEYSEPTLWVLASLAGGPSHGHAMIAEIVRLGGTRLGPGTLYGAITRLEQQGWIEPLPPEDRRRPYRLTGDGAEVLRHRLITLGRLSLTALRLLEAQ